MRRPTYLSRVTYVLHYAPDNASLIVRLTLEASGLPYETRLVDRRQKAQKNPAYLQLNPAGRIPVLETPDGPVFETAAILLWLGARHAHRRDIFDRPQGDYLSWLLYCANTLHAHLITLFYPHRVVPRENIPMLQRGVSQVICQTYAILNAARTEAFGQDIPGPIDFYIAACLRWSALYGPEDRNWFQLDAYPHLHQIAQRVETSPAGLAVAQAEGLGPQAFSRPQPANPPEGSAL